ncbi:bis(5'-nucleosyl)-tetraphosphatase (symmetrical) YqeK [Lysinibacillus sphaericus]|uniref:bis(5'-nucleosyl)-tetraphosphatase (symmetrical) n=1 Tax=Lysinibacillus sphaericus OT4b.31 TaxID=1285586 RepID=R7ZCE1_LYSSH|nr:bis(5'-nucleosyl)-tetraphosphatase (symmetrical) YqeK [Lysinibacillus sphaericus]EON71820.1 hypothetical protein H131_15093 [Lysinibacillus sphaericus OT4b.31]
MEREQYLAAIKPRMPEKRYIHTIGVMETAIALAKVYGEDEKRAETAAILHDIAKYADIAWMEKIVREQQLDQRLIGWGSELLHGPVGAYIAEHEFGIADEDLLNAIRFHTTGRVGMSRLEKILFVADMIEPNRQFDGVERLRKKAQKNLDKAVSACVRHTLAFLIDTRQPIYPLSIDCYNDLMKREDSEG